MTGALFIVVTVILAEVTLVVLGLVPPDELSDSVLRTMVTINTYAIWVAGAFAVGLFLGAGSVAILGATPRYRWLGWAGLTGAGVSLVGAL